ncbi:dTDP-4-dehydrorhamnose 3,5-epimerase family protein [Pseudomonas protegens]|uniref:dTDP-4-dehydrorhamnose 3,5-epimerase family protein n=1 Tax=Pseudomonas protegens TaxID=380021 RepID=UPI0037FA5F02
MAEPLALAEKIVPIGLHYPIKQSREYLGHVVHDGVSDIAVDLLKSSTTFDRLVGMHLSAERKHQLWGSEGFSHSLVLLSEYAEFLYEAADYYAPKYKCGIYWDYTVLKNVWSLDIAPALSLKDVSWVKNILMPRCLPDA